MSSPNFFTTGSPYLDHPLLTAERTTKEIEFVLSEINISPGGRILDVGCGPGRHSIELTRRGYQVVGIDPAAAMIAAARSRASEAGVSPIFRRAAGEEFSTDEVFDAAICLFTTLGQMDGEKDNQLLVPRAASALRPGGCFIVEVPQRSWVTDNLKPSDRFGNGENYTDVIRSFDPAEHTVTEIFKLVSPDETRQYVLRYRLYSQDELSILLKQAGLNLLAVYGGYDKDPLTAKSPVIVTIAQRATSG